MVVVLVRGWSQTLDVCVTPDETWPISKIAHYFLPPVCGCCRSPIGPHTPPTLLSAPVSPYHCFSHRPTGRHTRSRYCVASCLAEPCGLHPGTPTSQTGVAIFITVGYIPHDRGSAHQSRRGTRPVHTTVMKSPQL